MEATHEPLPLTDVLCSKRSYTYIQVLFESLFYLTKLLNMFMVQNFEVMLGQTLNHSV
jgi:hypothetical protein